MGMARSGVHHSHDDLSLLSTEQDAKSEIDFDGVVCFESGYRSLDVRGELKRCTIR